MAVGSDGTDAPVDSDSLSEAAGMTIGRPNAVCSQTSCCSEKGEAAVSTADGSIGAEARTEVAVYWYPCLTENANNTKSDESR